MNLIEKKTISCLTLKGNKKYPYLNSPLCKYNYKNVKTLFIFQFRTTKYKLTSLKENKSGCNILVTDMHIHNNKLFSWVSNKSNIYSVFFT